MSKEKSERKVSLWSIKKLKNALSCTKRTILSYDFPI